MKSIILLTSFALSLGAAPVVLRDEVTKFGHREIEVMLPTRDGTALHTLIFLPKDASSTNKVPTIMDRSPYG